jgi:hypothetical protein
MKRQLVCIWTGGKPDSAKGCEMLAKALPDLPDPDPLCRAALIDFHWGNTHFEIVATACSIRCIAWGSKELTWLHCKAMRTAEIKADEKTSLIAVLIPAHYVTRIRPGPTFRIGRSRKSQDLGLFPPNKPAPVDAVPLAEVERVITELLAPERN